MDLDALWTAARAAPDDDDAPRMVLADALTDRGDPRGEFVRAQCELERAADPERRAALDARQRELLARHGAAWVEDLPRGTYEFRWGLVAEAWLACEAFARDGAALGPHAPRLALHLGGAGLGSPESLAVARSEHLAGLRALTLGFQGDHATLAALADNPRLATVRALGLDGGWYVDDASARALAASPHLGALERFSLRTVTGALRGAGVRALLEAPALARCASFAVAGATLDADGARDVAASRALGRFPALALTDCKPPDAAVAALVEAPAIAAVRSLHLHGNEVGAGGAAAIARSPALGALAALDLCGVEKQYDRGERAMGDAGLAAVAGSTALASLRSLRVGFGCRITAAGARALAEGPLAAGLDALDLSRIPLAPEDLEAVAASLPRLRRLRLHECGLADAHFDVLARAPLPGLERLEVVWHRASPAARDAVRARWGARAMLDGVREPPTVTRR